MFFLYKRPSVYSNFWAVLRFVKIVSSSPPPLSVSTLPFHLACLRLSCLSVEELETLAAGTMPRTYHTVDRLEERGVEKGSARRSSLKGRKRAVVNQTNIGTVETSGRRVEHIWAFPSAYIPSSTELNWTWVVCSSSSNTAFVRFDNALVQLGNAYFHLDFYFISVR